MARKIVVDGVAYAWSLGSSPLALRVWRASAPRAVCTFEFHAEVGVLPGDAYFEHVVQLASGETYNLNRPALVAGLVRSVVSAWEEGRAHRVRDGVSRLRALAPTDLWPER
ncbi:MAG: hypothetical protein H6720_28960 [Sandaracinus sp.]|nr:hypothetical protein [Sandaracinus sp.]